MWIIINLSKWDLFKVLFPNLEQHSEYSKTDWLQWGQHSEIDFTRIIFVHTNPEMTTSGGRGNQ